MSAYQWATGRPEPRVIADLGGSIGCSWCGCQVATAAFAKHVAACEKAARSGVRSMFGGTRGLFDELPEMGGGSIAVEVSVLCSQGQHGTAQRRYVAGDGWQSMWSGRCAGSVYDARDGSEQDCPCSCHEVEA